MRQILKEELTAIADKYGDDRCTEIQDVEDEIDIEDLIEEEDCVFTLTQAGYIKRTPVSEYAAQSKGGMGKKGITTREEDVVVDVFTASTHDYILFFTDTGKVYRKKGYQIPEAGKTAKGTNIVNILQVEQGERVQTMVHTRDIEDEENRFLVMVTRNGTVKRLPVGTLKNLRNNGIRALRMEEGDAADLRPGDRRHPEDPHRHPRRTWPSALTKTTCGPWAGTPWASGASGCVKATMWWAPPGPGKTVLSITEKGYGKRTPVEEYRITGRGGLGIRNYAVTEKTGGVVGIKVVDGSEDLLLVTQERHPDPHPGGQHPGGRPVHPGRHRHALQGRGRPGDLHGPDGPRGERGSRRNGARGMSLTHSHAGGRGSPTRSCFLIRLMEADPE